MTATTSASKAICVEKTTAEIIEVRQLQLQIAVFQVKELFRKIRIKTKLKCDIFNSEVELLGGSGLHEGHIFVGGQPVCGRNHDEENALVVCRLDNFTLLNKTWSKKCSQDVGVH